MAENSERGGQAAVAAKSSFGEKLRGFLPKKQLVEQYRPLFEAPKGSWNDLVHLEEKDGGWRFRDFFRMARGLISYNALPLTMEQPSLLTSHMLDLRQYAQREDNEESSGVYRDSKSGDWYYLKNPVKGKYNAREHYYEAGEVPTIEGLENSINIHSHPAHARDKEKFGEKFTEFRVSTNLQSDFDLASALHLDDRKISVVVGKELAVAICRTRQTPKIRAKRESPYMAYVRTVNNIILMNEEYQKENPDEQEFEKRLHAVAKFCKDNEMGFYMMALRDHISTRSQWTRMYPLPKDTEAAIQNLLKVA